MDTSKILVFVIIGGLFYVAGQYIASQPQRVAEETAAQRQIAVQGHGEVQAKPDIAQISLGMQTEPQSTAAAATDQLGKKFQAITDQLKQLGVKDADVKTTNLSIQPQYDYQDGRQTLRGYQASENIEVKVRDLNKIGDVVAQTTTQGANQVGGVSFTIDDPEKLQQQAEAAAIKNAQANADQLAKSLGVHLGRVKSYSANTTPETPRPYYAAGMGGDALSAEKVAVPPVPSGSQQITSNVTVTYELR